MVPRQGPQGQVLPGGRRPPGGGCPPPHRPDELRVRRGPGLRRVPDHRLRRGGLEDQPGASQRRDCPARAPGGPRPSGHPLRGARQRDLLSNAGEGCCRAATFQGSRGPGAGVCHAFLPPSGEWEVGVPSAATPHAGRADQYLGRLRRPADPQGVPPDRGGHESGNRDRAVPERGIGVRQRAPRGSRRARDRPPEPGIGPARPAR